MPKKFSSLLFFSLLIGLVTTQPSVAQDRLAKIIYSDGSVRQFFYDAKGKLSKEEHTDKQNPVSQIQHNFGTNGKLTAYLMRYQHPENPWNYGFSEQYHYNQQGQLSTKERYILRQGQVSDIPEKALFFSDSLIYNSAGQTVGRQRYTYTAGSEAIGKSPVTLITNQYRYNEQGNLVEETVTTVPLQRSAAATTQIRRIVYEYDNKLNPYYLTACPVFDQLSWSKNNCIRTSIYQNEAGKETKPSVSEYRYVYNNNLPVSRIHTDGAAVLEQYEYETN